MVTTMTATEVLQSLYDKGRFPCGNAIRRCLCAWSDLEKPWIHWSQREKHIRNYTYSRNRDTARAFRQNDFRLARELDEAAA